jgi:microcompartment protein CcmL/EutN
MSQSVGLLEITGFAPSIVVADAVIKSADVAIIAAEINGLSQVVIKLAGSTADLEAAVSAGKRIADDMHAHYASSVYPRLSDQADRFIHCKPAYNPLLQGPEHWFPHEVSPDARSSQVPPQESFALGLIETQGLVAMIEAADAMLKSADVELVGKEKIGAGYVTIMVKGDVAAVRAAVEAGTSACQSYGKHISSHVIARPHDELTRLLPAD